MKSATRYLLFLHAFGIANAMDLSSTHLAFYGDKGCQDSPTIDCDTLVLLSDNLQSGCVQIPKTNTWNASSVSIANPEQCVIRVFQEKTCDNMIAYAMHWNEEPSCFPLSGSVDGTYYASIGCLKTTPSWLMPSPTANATL
jgi:hypothetical protein